MGFDQYVDQIILFEGGLTDDSKLGDRGGLTKYGIDQASHPDVDIKNLTLSQAKQIYFRDYWIKPQCDIVPDLLQFAYFDACVNQGPQRAKRLLQSALGLKADGIFGPITLKVFKDFQVYSNDVKASVLISFLAGRMFEYGILGIFKTFGRGWAKRLMTVAWLSFKGAK